MSETLIWMVVAQVAAVGIYLTARWLVRLNAEVPVISFGTCDVCNLLEGDSAMQLVAYCKACKAWMCKRCRKSLARRAAAWVLRGLKGKGGRDEQ